MHTHNIYAHPCSLNCIWLNSRKALLCDTRLCWCKRCRASPSPQPWEGAGLLMLQLPCDPAAHTPQSHHISGPQGFHARAVPSLPSPFRWLLEVHGTYLQAFSSWKISTNRKFSHFPGWKPNSNIRNACPYFQFFPFSAIPPFLSGNTQLRLSGL